MAAISHILAEEACQTLKTACLLTRVASCTTELNYYGAVEDKNKCIDSFVSFIFSHFANEELAMNIHLYPNFLAHQEDHSLYCCAVVDKFKDVRSGLSTFGELQTFLVQKLCGHISVFDSDYIRFLTINNLL